MKEPKAIKKSQGFTLIEVLLCIALIAIALLGLAQIFTLSVLNNMRSDRLTTASFLAQQQVDYIRNLTVDEISTFYFDQKIDEIIDINNDSTPDYRRITVVESAKIETPPNEPSIGQLTGNYFKVQVLVFSAEQINKSLDDLIDYPERYRVKAQLTTIISR